MSYSRQIYTGDGSVQSFQIGFPFLNQSDIKVYVSNVLQDFTWSGSTTINITTVPPDNSIIEIKRTTNVATRVIDFVDGSIFTEDELDTAFLQSFYTIQEVHDDLTQGILTHSNLHDAQGLRITNVGDGEAAGDAVTVGQLLTSYPAVSTVADNIGAVNTLSDNMPILTTAALNNYGALPSPPSNPLEGVVYYDTTMGVSRQYNGNLWISLNGRARRYRYKAGTPSAGYDGSLTNFPTAHTLGQVDVYVNGLHQEPYVEGLPYAYTETETSVILNPPAVAGYSVVIVGYEQQLSVEQPHTKVLREDYFDEMYAYRSYLSTLLDQLITTETGVLAAYDVWLDTEATGAEIGWNYTATNAYVDGTNRNLNPKAWTGDDLQFGTLGGYNPYTWEAFLYSTGKEAHSNSAWFNTWEYDITPPLGAKSLSVVVKGGDGGGGYEKDGGMGGLAKVNNVPVDNSTYRVTVGQGGLAAHLTSTQWPYPDSPTNSSAYAAEGSNIEDGTSSKVVGHEVFSGQYNGQDNEDPSDGFYAEPTITVARAEGGTSVRYQGFISNAPNTALSSVGLLDRPLSGVIHREHPLAASYKVGASFTDWEHVATELSEANGAVGSVHITWYGE
jgi:hypothetical protein